MEGQENIQEILTKQLVLCQYMCALAILRPGLFSANSEFLYLLFVW